MAANKYIALVSGKLKEQFASNVSAANAVGAMDSTGRFDIGMMPVGLTAEVITGVASEALVAGNFVNVYNLAGVVNVRKADATTNGKPATGFVLAGFSSSATATVYQLSQSNTQLSALTVGTEYFLSTTPGGVTTTPPSTAGNIVQSLGITSSATAMVFDNKTYYEVA